MVVVSNFAGMRQLEERQVEHEVCLLAWSPKMDILAVAFMTNEVSLYRLNWQKIWTTSGFKSENCVCSLISWRIDGKLFAVAFSNGQISILHIDKNIPVHVLKCESPVTFIRWIPGLDEVSSGSPTCLEGDSAMSYCEAEEWAFMEQFPTLKKSNTYSTADNSSLYENHWEEAVKFNPGDSNSFLITASKTGFIDVYINGHLLCAHIDVIGKYVSQNQRNSSGEEYQIVDVCVNSNLTVFSVSILESVDRFYLVLFRVSVFNECYGELISLYRTFAVCSGALEYMKQTLGCITEAYEDVLMEIDVKLGSYRAKVPNGGIAADFLELLMFGIPSMELEHFLIHDLSDKGLKKFSVCVETSYSNIQKLIQKYLHCVSRSLNYHLAEMLGTVRASEREYTDMLGVRVSSIESALGQAACFWAKSVELLQVIDESTVRFESFFRWILVEILTLMDESLPDEYSQVSQRDIRNLAEFLDTFSESTFNMERVGQYLATEPLKHPVDRSQSAWHKLVKDNINLTRALGWSLNENSSLMMEYDRLVTEVEFIFGGMKLVSADDTLSIQPEVWRLPVPILQRGSEKRFLCEQLCEAEFDRILGYVVVEDEIGHKMLIYQITNLPSTATGENLGVATIRGMWVNLVGVSIRDGGEKHSHLNSSVIKTPQCENRIIVKAQFYTHDTVSLLMERCVDQISSSPLETHTRVLSAVDQFFCQLPITGCDMYFSSFDSYGDTWRTSFNSLKTCNIIQMGGNACERLLEDIIACDFSVSGSRKVSAFVFQNQKRVRTYDMEVEIEEDTEDDIRNSCLSSSDANISG